MKTLDKQLRELLQGQSKLSDPKDKKELHYQIKGISTPTAIASISIVYLNCTDSEHCELWAC